jgi:16S rRNA (guanine527-N7)-methyltransferase
MEPARALDTAQHIVNKRITEISPLPRDLVTRFLAEVLEWTDEVPLVSRRDPAGACERLLLESLELMAFAGLADSDHVADIGSGAGFPGVVWSLARPNVNLVLIERHERKGAFLERLIRVLDLRHVDVMPGDVRSLVGIERWRGHFELMVAMAVGNSASLMADTRSLMATAGRFARTVPSAAGGEAPPGFVLESEAQGQYGRYACYRSGI